MEIVLSKQESLCFLGDPVRLKAPPPPLVDGFCLQILLFGKTRPFPGRSPIHEYASEGRTANDLKKKKSSLFLETFLAAVGRLGIALILVVFFWHLSKGKRILESLTKNGVQTLQGIIATNPDFLFTAQMEKGALIPPALLSGWFAQIRSMLRSLPSFSFPWPPSDLRLIARLARTFERFFRERSPHTKESGRHSPVATVREILTIRQALAKRLVLIQRSLSRESRNLDRALDRIEAGIFGVGLAAFGLFSFSVLIDRNALNALKKLSASEAFLRALIEVLPTAFYCRIYLPNRFLPHFAVKSSMRAPK